MEERSQKLTTEDVANLQRPAKRSNPEDPSERQAVAVEQRPQGPAEVGSQARLPEQANGSEVATPGPETGLIDDEAAGGYRQRWDSVQSSFVDEPRRAVEEADRLVAEVIQHLASTFAGEHTRLEGEWSRGGEVSTEDLRTALQRYRHFFQLLLRT